MRSLKSGRRVNKLLRYYKRSSLKEACRRMTKMKKTVKHMRIMVEEVEADKEIPF